MPERLTLCKSVRLEHHCFSKYDPANTGAFMPSPCWLRGLLAILRGTAFGYPHPRYLQLDGMSPTTRLQMLRGYLQDNPNRREYFARSDWGLWCNPLVEAVKVNFAEAIPELINAGFPVDGRCAVVLPATALYVAVSKGNEDCVRALLGAGADAGKKSGPGFLDVNDGKEDESPLELAQRLRFASPNHGNIFNLISQV